MVEPIPKPASSEIDLRPQYLDARMGSPAREAADELLRRYGGQAEEGRPAAPPTTAIQPPEEKTGPGFIERAGGITADVAKDIGRGILESPRQALGGVRDAVTENIKLVKELAAWQDRTFGPTPRPDLNIELPDVGQAKTVTGDVVRNVAQFLTDFVAVGKILKPIKAVGKTAKITKAMIQGFMADFAAFDPYEERLSNLIQSVPGLQNPVSEFLAANPDDTAAEGRLKNGLEGLGLGALTEGLGTALKLFKNTRQARAVVSEAGKATDIAEATRVFKSKLGEVDAEPVSISRATVEGEHAVNINLARLDTAEDIKAAIDETARRFKPSIEEARRGVQTNKATAALADELNMNVDDLLRRRRGQAFNAEEAFAARRILVSSADQLVDLANRAVASTDEADLVAFRRAYAIHGAIQHQVSGLTAEAGRALQQFNMAPGSQEAIAGQIRDLLDASGGANASRALAEQLSILAKEKGRGAVNEFARKGVLRKTTDGLLELWINGLLTNPVTHAVNTISNSAFALWQVPERALAAQIGELTGSKAIPVGEASAQLFGVVQGAKDGLVLAAKVLRTGEPVDILGKTEARQYRAISAEALEMSGLAGRAFDYVGEVVRLPTARGLNAEDAFFRGVGYRMELHAQAFRTATEEGLKGRAFAGRIADIIANPPENIHLSAIDASRYQTFTNRLGPSGRAIGQAINNQPWAKLLVPFYRTPVNILKTVGQRSPFAPLMESFRADVAAGGARRDLALARMSLGSLVMMGVADLTMTGQITGGGPTDPGLRANLRRTGWQPYSFHIGDKYYAYNRLDPTGATIGIAADMAEIMGQLGEVEANEIAAAGVMAVSKNVVNKTYMSGIADTMEVFSDPDRYGPAYVQRFAGSTVPAGVAHVERIMDPTLRDARTAVDLMRSRVPGYSKDLPARKNLWGDPILLGGGLGPDIVSPIYTSKDVSSPIDQVMIDNQISVRMPAREIDGVELTTEEYSRYVELAGAPARDALNQLVTGESPMSGMYERGTDGPDGTKATVIKSIIYSFRQAARAKMLLEFPDLRAVIDEKSKGIERPLQVTIPEPGGRPLTGGIQLP